MFEQFKKRHYKVCYTNRQGMPAVNRTTRRSGFTEIVLWQRPRPF
jgi:hypothetical protein